MVDEGGAQKAGNVGTVPRPRIQTLSDLIFGLALSIGALTLVGQQPSSTAQLVFAIALYGLSFLILISVWRLYSAVTSVLPSEGGLLVDLNIVLLFFVSIEPYLFNEIFALGGSMSDFVSWLYSLDLAAMFFILAFFTNALLDQEKHLIPRQVFWRWRFERNVTLLVAVIFSVSLLPYAGGLTLVSSSTPEATIILSLRSLLWILSLFVGWGGRAFAAAMSPRKERANST